MRRRDAILALLASAAILPSTPLAQTRGGKPFRIACIPDLGAARSPFLAAMKELGWLDGRDFSVVEYGVPPGPVNRPATERLVAERPDLILVFGTQYALAAQAITSTIPIVMRTSGYPVEAGVADSLARPGRNVTGNTAYSGIGVWGKMVQLLIEGKPGAKRLAALWGRVPPDWKREEIDPVYREVEQAARRLGIALKMAEVGSPDKVAAALETLGQFRPDVLLVSGVPGLIAAEDAISRFVLTRRLPTVSDSPWNKFEPLFGFGPHAPDMLMQYARYVVRILEGAKPGELPILLPSRFRFVVNLRSAKAIGLNVPQSILLQATEVIE